MTEPVRLTLPPAISRDDIDDAMIDFGWLLVNAIPASDRHPAQIVMLTEDRQHLVYVLDDARSDALAVVVQGANAERHAEALRARFPGGST